MKSFLFLISVAVLMIACSKSSSSSGGNGGGTYNNGTGLFPLAVNSVWNYKLKNYNTTTGAATDSTNFTLTAIGTTTVNGVTYFGLQNSLSDSTLWLTNLNSMTLGSIDSVNGVNYYTTFASGTGDSTQSISSWPADAETGCVGTERLFAYYADTTLTDFEGHVWSNCIKNIAVIFDCSDDKYLSQVFFVVNGIGLVRYAQYTYSSSGVPELQSVWLLQTYTLAN